MHNFVLSCFPCSSFTFTCMLRIENGSSQLWVAQVEVRTHSSANFPLWLGPQFKFKTYGGRLGQDGANSSLLSSRSSPASGNGVRQPPSSAPSAPVEPSLSSNGNGRHQQQQQRRPRRADFTSLEDLASSVEITRADPVPAQRCVFLVQCIAFLSFFCSN